MTGRHRGAERQSACRAAAPWDAPSSERAALSLSLVALGCSPSAQTRHCGTGGRWSPRVALLSSLGGPRTLALCPDGQVTSPPPVGLLSAWAEPWTPAPVFSLGGSVYTARHSPANPARPPPLLLRSLLLFSSPSQVSLRFCFCFFSLYCCTVGGGHPLSIT